MTCITQNSKVLKLSFQCNYATLSIVNCMKKALEKALYNIYIF